MNQIVLLIAITVATIPSAHAMKRSFDATHTIRENQNNAVSLRCLTKHATDINLKFVTVRYYNHTPSVVVMSVPLTDISPCFSTYYLAKESDGGSTIFFCNRVLNKTLGTITLYDGDTLEMEKRNKGEILINVIDAQDDN